jgi:outer membrane biosynthesis protein TonB
MSRAVSTTRLRGPLGLSVVLHASLVAAVFIVKPAPPPALPPVYKVNLVAAPASPDRAAGIVPSTPKATPPAPAATPPKRAEVTPKDMPLPAKPKPTPRKASAPATPTPQPKSTPQDAPAPVAKGGPEGGPGTDVANVSINGVEFADQAYINNIVRQIALRFKPRNPGALRADVFFIIRRDGSIGEFRFLNSSRVYAFDLEAQGAVESAGSSKAFGRLPDSYGNDFLPVIFKFDPSVIR